MNFFFRYLFNLSENELLRILIFLALAARVTTVIVLDIQPVSDYAGYHNMAINFLAGKGMFDGINLAFLSAGYPLFVLTPVYAAFGNSLLAAQLANALLGTFSTWLIYLIAREVGAGKLARLTSTALFALYLPSLIYAEYLAKENLMTPLMLGVLFLSLRLLYKSSIWTGAILGVVFGALAITGNAGMSMLLILLIALAISTISIRTKFIHCAVVVLVGSLVVAPWLIRNDQVIGAPVLNSNGGFNLYLGNNANATGFFITIADTPRGDSWNQLLKDKGELAASNVLKAEAINWIKANPVQALTLSLKKGIFFWIPPTHEGKGFQSNGEKMVRLAWLLQYLLICFAALFSLTFKSLRTQKIGLMWLAILGYTALHMIFYVIFRYREPIMPLVIILAALFIERIVSTKKIQN